VRVKLIRVVITGDLINKPIGTSLSLVARDANLTENDKITIIPVSVLLEITMDLGLAHQILACALLMINITTSTNAVATRINPTGKTFVQEIVRILSVLILEHNIKEEINTKGPNVANLIATHRLLEISTVIKEKLVTTTVTRGSLVVSIAIRDIIIRQDPIHRIHAFRAVRKGDKTIIHTVSISIQTMRQSRSYSKVTTSILTKTSLLNLIHIKPKWIQMHHIDDRIAMSHAYPMVVF
jgi:hypothetical protein